MNGSGLAEAVLQAKEKLYAQKVELARKYHTGLISVALNIPYPERIAERFNPVFNAAVCEVEKALATEGIRINESFFSANDAGNCLVISADADPLLLKRLCVAIENNHKWGRLFDLDVWDCEGKHIKRSQIGYNKRCCMVCDDYAVNCIVSKRHSKNEVLDQVERLLGQ